MFQRSLTRPWSALGVSATPQFVWWHPERYRPLLRAVRQYWDLWQSVGTRYTNGQQVPRDLWSSYTAIKYALANLGIPTEELNAPLPPGGLAELIDRTERHLH